MTNLAMTLPRSVSDGKWKAAAPLPLLTLQFQWLPLSWMTSLGTSSLSVLQLRTVIIALLEQETGSPQTLNVRLLSSSSSPSPSSLFLYLSHTDICFVGETVVVLELWGKWLTKGRLHGWINCLAIVLGLILNGCLFTCNFFSSWNVTSVQESGTCCIQWTCPTWANLTNLPYSSVKECWPSLSPINDIIDDLWTVLRHRLNKIQRWQ